MYFKSYWLPQIHVTTACNLLPVKNLQELRDIATTEAVKGKHFFLESDIKGPHLKLDNTGKAILTVSEHTSDFYFDFLLYII